MPERQGSRAATWVRTLFAVPPVAAAIASVALYLDELMEVNEGREEWIVYAGVAIALSGLISIPTSSGNKLTPSYIVVAALPLVAKRLGDGVTVTEVDPIFSLRGSMAAILGGIAALWAVRIARGEDPLEAFGRFLRRGLVFSAYLFFYHWLATSSLFVAGEWRRVSMFALAGLGAFFVEGLVDVMLTGGPFGGRLRYRLSSIASDGAVFVSLLATGALLGLSYEAIDGLAVLVAVLPYAFTALAFRRLAQTKETYEQTLIALAQIPEVGGHTPMGHAARTNDLAKAVAKRIGVSPKDYEHINYASFLHDIGRITLNEPSILRQGFTDVDLAGWGAEIVGETKYLEDVAMIVRRQHEPFRSPGEVSNPDLPLASRIIKVCSAYDESVHEMGFSPLEALERIHRGTVYDFDPDVVRELRAVLERRGVLNQPVSVTPG